MHTKGRVSASSRGASRPKSPRSVRRGGVEQIFAGYPAAKRLYVSWRDYIFSLGDVEVIVRKTQVGFAHKRQFAWIWLPQMWIRKAPRGSITIAFGLDHQVRDPRVKESTEAYPGRFTHHVVITSTTAREAKLRRWLREAYDLAGKRRSRSRTTRRVTDKPR